MRFSEVFWQILLMGLMRWFCVVFYFCSRMLLKVVVLGWVWFEVVWWFYIMLRNYLWLLLLWNSEGLKFEELMQIGLFQGLLMDGVVMMQLCVFLKLFLKCLMLVQISQKWLLVQDRQGVQMLYELGLLCRLSWLVWFSGCDISVQLMRLCEWWICMFGYYLKVEVVMQKLLLIWQKEGFGLKLGSMGLWIMMV